MSEERESRAQMQRRLDDGWAQVRELVDSVPAEEMEQPGVVEHWSMKDLLGHMAFWAGKAARDLEALKQGRPDDIETPGGEQGTADWNDREYRRRKDLPPATVRAEWEKSFEDARSALAGAPEDLLWQEVKGWPQAARFREDTYNHYLEHSEHIRAWLRQTETSEA